MAEKKNVYVFSFSLFASPLTLAFIPRQILEVAQGIEYIHSEGAIHGDIRGVLYLRNTIFDTLTIL